MAGNKHSKKRDWILKIFENSDLLDANEVCKKLQNIDRATVYRNSTLFVEQKILRQVNIKKNVAPYELNQEGDYHQHFICVGCDKVIAVGEDPQLIRSFTPAGVE